MRTPLVAPLLSWRRTAHAERLHSILAPFALISPTPKHHPLHRHHTPHTAANLPYHPCHLHPLCCRPIPYRSPAGQLVPALLFESFHQLRSPPLQPSDHLPTACAQPRTRSSRRLRALAASFLPTSQPLD
ncbi:hypothetical protein BCV70DRAFT_20593 [Testicularia cyperi]|uniref:Uncharacterized protein n=1 Tax=Testicularia cyperi TaxID=1882483 RepID=A0A317XZD7_9BASI|nr:hypothetical protein BCV70DRAFT_20593 [Testicularia cyperi]